MTDLKAAYLDALRQIAEDSGLNAVWYCAILQDWNVSDQHRVTLSSFFGIHEILNTQGHSLLVEAPQQLQQAMHIAIASCTRQLHAVAS